MNKLVKQGNCDREKCIEIKENQQCQVENRGKVGYMSELLWADRKIPLGCGWVKEENQRISVRDVCLSLEWEDKSPAGNAI